MAPNSDKTKSYKILMLQLRPPSAQQQADPNQIHGCFLAVGEVSSSHEDLVRNPRGKLREN